MAKAIDECNERAYEKAESELLAPPCSVIPTEGQVLKAVYDSGLHQYALRGVLTAKWKDGIDIDEPSIHLINFVRKLWHNDRTKPRRENPNV